MRMPELLQTPYTLRGKVGRRGVPGYVVNGRAVELAHVPYLQERKRLSDAELAAEYWAPAYIHFPDPAFFDGDFDEVDATVRERMKTILRFALNPHQFASPATTRAHA